jgi:hypothetical protein
MSNEGTSLLNHAPRALAMTTRPRNGLLIALVLVVLGWSRPATAGLVLEFNESIYTINGVGSTTSVQVLVTQNSTGPQVSPSNTLLTGGVALSFPTAGVAAVLSMANVTGGPAWDNYGVAFTTSGANTVVNLTVSSLAGISSIPTSGLLIGTFVFTSSAVGSEGISVATLGPGISFITSGDDDLDPTNVPTAMINVTSSAIPEPGALVLLCAAGVTLGSGWLCRRIRSF